MSTLADDPRLAIDRGDFRGLLVIGRRRLAQGELGTLPVIVALVLIAIVFQILTRDKVTGQSTFLTLGNLVDLTSQIAAVGVVAVGVTLVLLLGEIDLSVGAVAGVAAAVLAVLNVTHRWSGPLAVIAALFVGAVIGFFQGIWITKVRVPAFVVTLAGLLGYEGLKLWILGAQADFNLSDPFVVGIVNGTLDVTVGWIVGVVLFLGVTAAFLRGRRQRQKGGLKLEPAVLLVIKLILIGVGIFGLIGLMNINRSPNPHFPIQGVTSAAVVLISVVIVFDLIVRRTSFGRHLFAVGGNAEAARRAGISVDGIRIAVFTLAATLAAFGGIVGASRGGTVTQGQGQDILLNAIAAAVIGGTSLFGGRGSVWSALLGALVIGSITNGMVQLSLGSSYREMITGAVLLLAVSVDALSRRGRQAAGRA